jgi:hypothetical protein
MKTDKVRQNYYIKREVAEYAKIEANEKGCSISYFIQMLIEEYRRRQLFEED